MIIGIAGAFGSGKTTAASFFAKKGFTIITLSSFLEEEAAKRNLPLTRKTLQDIGNEWREHFGKGILAQKALEKIKEKNIANAVIDGIRNIGEIETLRKDNDFVMLAIVTNRKLRFKRLQQKKRREELTFEIFEQLDYRDLGIHEKDTGLQVAFCIALADIFIDNNGSEEEFEQKLNQIL